MYIYIYLHIHNCKYIYIYTYLIIPLHIPIISYLTIDLFLPMLFCPISPVAPNEVSKCGTSRSRRLVPLASKPTSGTARRAGSCAEAAPGSWGADEIYVKDPPFFMGKLTISTGPFSIAMLNYQRVCED